ncbi:unnamed protein product [Ixodes pacificus]
MLTRTGFLRRAPNVLPACRASRVQDQRNEKRRSSRRRAFRRGPTTPSAKAAASPVWGIVFVFVAWDSLLQGTAGRGEGCLSLYPQRRPQSEATATAALFTYVFLGGGVVPSRQKKRSLLQWRRQSGFVEGRPTVAFGREGKCCVGEGEGGRLSSTVYSSSQYFLASFFFSKSAA